jgi:hypothetical protein
MHNIYTITVKDDTLEFSILKDGIELPFHECKNVEWAMQGMLAVIKRTEGEVERRKKMCTD